MLRLLQLFTIEIGGEKKVVISGYENAAYVLIKKGENSSERSVGENRQTALSTAVTADPGIYLDLVSQCRSVTISHP